MFVTWALLAAAIALGLEIRDEQRALRRDFKKHFTFEE